MVASGAFIHFRHFSITPDTRHIVQTLITSSPAHDCGAKLASHRDKSVFAWLGPAAEELLVSHRMWKAWRLPKAQLDEHLPPQLTRLKDARLG